MDNTKISKGILLGIRIAALLLLIFFFIPSVCVSCQGTTVDVSGFNAAIGNITVESEEIDSIDAAPWLFIIPILIIAIGVIATKYHFVTMACAFANIVMMYIFKGAVKDYVKDSVGEYAGYIKVESTAAFSFAIILSLLVILAVAFDKFILNDPKNKEKLEELIRKYIKQETPPAKTCSTCGHTLSENAMFCTECGTPVKNSQIRKDSANAEAPITVTEDEQ